MNSNSADARDQTKKNGISLCMIVKNEAANIEKCLLSVKEKVNEIIIADTGSEDNTIELCRKHNANVYEYKWNDDFSAARNFTISKASYSWILVLDADEYLENADFDFLNFMATDSGFSAYSFKRLNVNSKGDWEDYVTRFFKNIKDIYFEDIIHECVDKSLAENNLRLAEFPVRIIHTGCMDEEKFLEKSRRYYELIKREHSLRGHSDYRMFIKLAGEYEKQKKYKEEENVYLEGIKYFKNAPEFYRRLALLYAGHMKRYSDALVYFKRYREFDEKLIKTEEADFNISKCFFKLKDFNSAREYYEKLLRCGYSSPEFFNFGISLYDSLGLPAKTAYLINKLIKIEPTGKNYFKGALRCIKNNNLNKAAAFLKKILETNPADEKAAQLLKKITPSEN